MLTQEKLNEIFEYKGGMIFWKIDIGRKIKTGKQAGCRSQGKRYRQVGINGTLYTEHKVIWIMRNGPMPDGLLIDHKDGDCFNNCIENLRLATGSENSANKKTPKNNTSGYKGVNWHKPSKTWRACVTSRGKAIQKHFSNVLDAAIARKEMAQVLHGDFFNNG